MVINRGFGEFILKKEENVQCPKCCCSQTLVLRNLGFIKCAWTIKGVLNLDHGDNSQMISFDGKCYDSCLYTMKEVDVKSNWLMLRIIVEKLDEGDLNEI